MKYRLVATCFESEEWTDFGYYGSLDDLIYEIAMQDDNEGWPEGYDAIILEDEVPKWLFVMEALQALDSEQVEFVILTMARTKPTLPLLPGRLDEMADAVTAELHKLRQVSGKVKQRIFELEQALYDLTIMCLMDKRYENEPDYRDTVDAAFVLIDVKKVLRERFAETETEDDWPQVGR